MSKKKALKPRLQPIRWYDGVPYRGSRPWSKPKGRDMNFHAHNEGILSQYRMGIKPSGHNHLRMVGHQTVMTCKKPQLKGAIHVEGKLRIKVTGTIEHDGKKYYTIDHWNL